MQTLQRPIHRLARNQYPVKILQFGSSNFLLGFADWMVQMANEKAGFDAGISVVQGISSPEILFQDDGVFTVVLKGIREEEFINQQYKIDTIQRFVNPINDFASFLEEGLNPELQFIISDTAEGKASFNEKDASVNVIASAFPGKLTQLLYQRFTHKLDNSLLVLPTGQEAQTGNSLKAQVQKYCDHWCLPTEFSTWLSMRVTFCNTLVDRIVSPGKSKVSSFTGDEFDHELVVEGEWFHLWVIEGPRWIEEVLPLRKAGLNVIYTDDLAPYVLRKVRILNAAQTCLACVGLLAGLHTLRETIEHPVTGKYLKRMIYDDIVPVVPGKLLDLERYAEEVINRFRNPALDHELVSINTNGFSKFITSVLPTLQAQVDRSGVVHDRLTFSLAAMIFNYRTQKDVVLTSVKENEEVIELMHRVWKGEDNSKKGMEARCRLLLSDQKWWGSTLINVPNLVERTGHYLYSIDQLGIIGSLKEL